MKHLSTTRLLLPSHHIKIFCKHSASQFLTINHQHYFFLMLWINTQGSFVLSTSQSQWQSHQQDVCSSPNGSTMNFLSCNYLHKKCWTVLNWDIVWKHIPSFYRNVFFSWSHSCNHCSRGIQSSSSPMLSTAPTPHTCNLLETSNSNFSQTSFISK